MFRPLPRLSLALALVLFAGACRHPGMMFLCLSVTRGGEPLVELWFDASDSSDVDEIWAEAGWGGRGIFLEALPQAEKPSPAAPREVRLRGPVTLTVRHNEHVWSQVTLDGVLLERGAPGSGWRLSAADVARAQRAASR